MGHDLRQNARGGGRGWEDRTMRHVRFDIASLALERVDVPLKAAYLLVAQTDDGELPQWEVLAYALDTAPLRFVAVGSGHGAV